MLALERQSKIIDLLTQNGGVQVSSLSREMGVTEETIRRDLEKLEAQELLLRTHGGAVPFRESTLELSLEKRKMKNPQVKERIAKTALDFVCAGDTIFLDASTTTLHLAKRLKGFTNITVITNSLLVINELSGKERIKVISTGGVLSDNMSFVGGLAQDMIAHHFFVNKMFFSSKGVTADAGILESNEQESAIKSNMFANCKEKYYLCDSSKIGQVGFIKLAAFEQIDYFITDALLDNSLQGELENADVKIIGCK